MENLTYIQTQKINHFFINNLPKLWDKFIGEIIEAIPNWQEDADEIIHNIIKSKTHLDIISEETGEVLETINFEDILEDTAEVSSILPVEKIRLVQGYDSAAFGAEALIAKWKKRAESVNKHVAGMDTKMKELNNVYAITHSFFSGKTNNYVIEGITNHKPEWEGFWHDTRNDLKVQAYDETGKLTDRFYGDQNDFDEWFLARANRGVKMKITAIIARKWVNIGEIKNIHFGGMDFHFVADNGISWKLV